MLEHAVSSMTKCTDFDSQWRKVSTDTDKAIGFEKVFFQGGDFRDGRF